MARCYQRIQGENRHVPCRRTPNRSSRSQIVFRRSCYSASWLTLQGLAYRESVTGSTEKRLYASTSFDRAPKLARRGHFSFQCR